MKNESKIYIAGHTGLVGSAIWKNLIEKGYTNLIGKTRKELNLLDQKAVEQFFAEEQPEYVFLAAAKVGGIVANNTYRADFIYENMVIQNNIVHHAWKSGVKKLLFLGSTCIYPKEAPQPIPEDSLLTSPLEYTNEPYAIAKIAGIKLCESYNIQYGTNFLSVMPTNLYGPNDNFDLERSHVLPALIRKIHLGKCLENNDWPAIRKDLDKRPIENISGKSELSLMLDVISKYGIIPPSGDQRAAVRIWGTGNPKREFLWSEDMADACVFLMENIDFIDIVHDTILRSRSEREKQSHDSGTDTVNQIRNTHINIGTGKDLSIRELAELIKKTIGFNGDLLFDNSKPDGTMRKLTDVRKLNTLGWRHTVEIEDGIKRMYDWYTA